MSISLEKRIMNIQSSMLQRCNGFKCPRTAENDWRVGPRRTCILKLERACFNVSNYYKRSDINRMMMAASISGPSESSPHHYQPHSNLNNDFAQQTGSHELQVSNDAIDFEE
jgi:hypothetical protein